MAELVEYGEAILMKDQPQVGLRAGDVGAVVMIYQDGAAYEVEFVTKQGKTLAVLTLPSDEVRAPSSEDMPHVRAMA